MIESALIGKLRKLNTEYENIDTQPERKVVINKTIESIKRDLARLGLKDDPDTLKSYGITNND